MSNLNAATVLAAIPVPTTVETAVLSSLPVGELQSSVTGEGVRISGVLNFTAGTGATGVTIRVRQGSGVGGAQIGNALAMTVVAGNTYQIPYDALDASPSAVAGFDQWTVTIQQAAATANGTVNQATIGVEAATSAF